MRLMDMITMVSDSAYEKVKDSDALDDAEKRSVAQAVGVAAIKIGDMLNHRSKDYVFDMERFLLGGENRPLSAIHDLCASAPYWKRLRSAAKRRASLCRPRPIRNGA